MKFNDEFYNKIKGTTIGLIFALTYGTLFIRHLQIKFNIMYTC